MSEFKILDADHIVRPPGKVFTRRQVNPSTAVTHDEVIELGDLVFTDRACFGHPAFPEQFVLVDLEEVFQHTLTRRRERVGLTGELFFLGR
ncbi:hypothetical protein D3C87_1765690 [compost metagenome]